MPYCAALSFYYLNRILLQNKHYDMSLDTPIFFTFVCFGAPILPHYNIIIISALLYTISLIDLDIFIFSRNNVQQCSRMDFAFFSFTIFFLSCFIAFVGNKKIIKWYFAFNDSVYGFVFFSFFLIRGFGVPLASFPFIFLFSRGCSIPS